MGTQRQRMECAQSQMVKCSVEGLRLPMPQSCWSEECQVTETELGNEESFMLLLSPAGCLEGCLVSRSLGGIWLLLCVPKWLALIVAFALCLWFPWTEMFSSLEVSKCNHATFYLCTFLLASFLSSCLLCLLLGRGSKMILTEASFR